MKRIIKVAWAVLLIPIVLLLILNTLTTRSLKTKIIIGASSVEVWKVLINHEAYPKWNPINIMVSGSTKPGDYLENTLQLMEMIRWISNLLYLKISLTRSSYGKESWV